jgi:hypothetical protein
VRAFGLRRCRYIGLAKTQLQQVFTVIAVNVARVDAPLSAAVVRLMKSVPALSEQRREPGRGVRRAVNLL